MGCRASPVQHASGSQQERSGADGGDATCPARASPHPIEQRRVRGRCFNALAAGHNQRIQRRPNRWERCGLETQASRGGHAAALRHDPKRIGRTSARLGDEIVGGCEHLKRPGDIEHLHRRIGEHVDDAESTWRRTRGLWHFRQSMLGSVRLVYPQTSRSAPNTFMEVHLAESEG